jgi:hypothetical protein
VTDDKLGSVAAVVVASLGAGSCVVDVKHLTPRLAAPIVAMQRSIGGGDFAVTGLILAACWATLWMAVPRHTLFTNGVILDEDCMLWRDLQMTVGRQGEIVNSKLGRVKIL